MQPGQKKKEKLISKCHWRGQKKIVRRREGEYIGGGFGLTEGGRMVEPDGGVERKCLELQNFGGSGKTGSNSLKWARGRRGRGGDEGGGEV